MSTNETETKPSTLTDSVRSMFGSINLVDLGPNLKLDVLTGVFFAQSVSGEILRSDTLSKLNENLAAVVVRENKKNAFKVPPAPVLVQTRDGWKQATYLGYVRGKGHRFNCEDGTVHDSGTNYDNTRISKNLAVLDHLNNLLRSATEATKRLEDAEKEMTTSTYNSDRSDCLGNTYKMLETIGIKFDKGTA